MIQMTMFFSSPFWLKNIGWVGSFWGSVETTCWHPLCLRGPQIPIGILWDGSKPPAISVGFDTGHPKKNSMNRISRNGSIINTYQYPHTSMVNQCESSRFDGEALNRRRFTGLQYCWKGNLPSNNETWLTGKSPINEGFNGKIIYKISTVQYTSWFSIAVLV